MGHMIQIGYFSTAVGQQATTTVHDILTVARRTNRSLAVTGLLVAASNRYLQVIEGPQHCVRAIYSKIVADKRHMGVTQFLNRPISERSFGSWLMAFRRPSIGVASDDFLALLRGLTSEGASTELQRQIALFARAMIHIEEEQERFAIRPSLATSTASQTQLETA